MISVTLLHLIRSYYFDICIGHDSCYFKNNGINYCQTIKQVLIVVSIILFGCTCRKTKCTPKVINAYQLWGNQSESALITCSHFLFYVIKNKTNFNRNTKKTINRLHINKSCFIPILNK